MEIVIKSFNRPYYLERCINSIYKYVVGDYKIIVLDDGTPPKYLEKISQLFPEVIIYRSPMYEQKVQAIQKRISDNVPFTLFSIPVNFWKQHISECSSFFLLLEDDWWLTESINLVEIENHMVASSIAMIKLSWLGNVNLIMGDIKPIKGTQLEIIEPKIPLVSKIVVHNTFKLGSVASRLKLLGNGFKYYLPYYTIYSVAAAFFKKDYWMDLWEQADEKVNESQQIKKAAQWLLRTNDKFGKTSNEVAKTSFLSSATNTYPGILLDLFKFNHILNQEWLAGNFNSDSNFPADFSIDYIGQQLDKHQDPDASKLEWVKWVERFKNQYILFGCTVD